MPQLTSPYLEGKYGWSYGESGWNSGMDENLLKFSFMFDKNIDDIVSSLPSPVSGKAYFLTTDSRLYFGVGNIFYSSPTPKWCTLRKRDTGQLYLFNGSTLDPVDSEAEVDSRLDALELSVSSLDSDLTTYKTQLTSAAGSTLIGHTPISGPTTTVSSLLNTNTSKIGELELNNTKRSVNVLSYGAKGDGVTDDTAAIQAALDDSLDVFIPPGIYILSSTLRARPRTHLYGSVAESTLLKRNGADYGNTLELGEETSDPSKNANLCHIHGLWFYREFLYTAGVTTTIPDPLSNGTSHLKLNGAQKTLIEDCMFWNMPILVDVVSSSLVTIRNNGFVGMIWDNRVATLQEGFAMIRLRNSGIMVGHTQLTSIHGNHINGGYFSAERSVTTGTVTTNMVECVGSLYGIYVEAAEGLSVFDNYLGACNGNNIYLNSTGLLTNVRIYGNFIDGSRDYAIFMNSTNGNPTVGVQIYGNDFNIQLINFGAIYAFGAGWTTVTKLTIQGNNIENSIQTPILLFSATGVNIIGNQISAYNYKRGGDNNVLYAAGILVGGVSERVFASGNSYGGNVNTLGGSNGCKWGIKFDGDTHGYAHAEYDLGRSIAAGTPLIEGSGAFPVRPNQVIHDAATGSYQLLAGDSVYIRTGTATTATVAALPGNPVQGQEITIKDNSNAGTFPIVIQDIISSKQIDGSASLNISTNNGFVLLRYNGTQWNRVG